MNPQNIFKQQQNQPRFDPYQTDDQEPSKKTIILALGGGLILIIILGLLLFSGGGDPNATKIAKLSSMIQAQNNIINVVQQYDNDVSSSDLLNILASAQINWQSEMNDSLKIRNTMSKSSGQPSRQVDKKTKQKLDSEQQAGNLDQNLAIEVINNLDQIKKDARSLSTLQPSKDLQAQLKDINNLVNITYDQVSPFTN